MGEPPIRPRPHRDVVDRAPEEVIGRPFDLRPGRTTYDILAAFRPHVNVHPDAAAFAAAQADIARTVDRAATHVASGSPGPTC